MITKYEAALAAWKRLNDAYFDYSVNTRHQATPEEAELVSAAMAAGHWLLAALMSDWDADADADE